MSEHWPKKCVDCQAEINYNGEDLEHLGFGPCKKHPGNHRVESITFYHSGARDIQDQRDRRRFSPQIVLLPSYPKVDPKTGLAVPTKGLMVQFYDGKYETDDPAKQFFLLTNAQCAIGPEGERMWREIYLTADQREAIVSAENSQLEAKNRKLREENAILEQVKANTRSGKPASA